MEELIFYRYQSVVYATQDINGDFVSQTIPNPEVQLVELNLHKETPKGYWIGYGKLDELHSTSRWVSKTSKKRYAYPTKKEAMTNFILRNMKRIRILQYQIDVCRSALFKANNIRNNIEK